MKVTKMLRTAKRKFPPAQVTAIIRVQIFDVDRGRTDARNVLAAVVRIDSDF